MKRFKNSFLRKSKSESALKVQAVNEVALELWSRSVVMEDGASVSSASGSAGAGSSSASSVGEEVVLRINVPELKVEKCLQFHKDDLVWDVKQQALAALPKGGLHGQTVRRTRFDRQVFEVMFERVNGVFGCRTRSTNVFDNQIPSSYVRTSLQTLVCRTAFDEPFDRVSRPLHYAR
ncbi:hypothetical protein SK128_005841 [Halocaridina rubra]|uniref:Uncharacterized protein n=1 Tax=Halocaridina rubra TaxID=373956 RepID=A0AAN8WW38_HALRR